MRRNLTGLAVLAAALSAAPASAATNHIFTIAGTGTAGFGGDGAAATLADLNDPGGITVVGSGPYQGILIADAVNNRVRRVAPTGVITTVAGTGTDGFSGDGAAATAATLDFPTDVSPTADGGFLLVDNGNARVRRVSPAGIITTVAGNGTTGSTGDGGPATAAAVSALTVAVLPDGGFLVSDSAFHRVRRVSAGGTITTVAGTGAACTPSTAACGDGGPATSAQLNDPRDITPTADGGFLISETLTHRVRRVAPDGTITTLAGTGTAGFSGDGGPATAARLAFPRGAAEAPDGSVLIADRATHRVRRVSTDGTITTVAGTGTECADATTACGDGGLATAADLNDPIEIAITADGGFLVSDSDNHRIRRVDADLRSPRGPAGTDGTAGPQGPAGAPGAAGPQGPAGVTTVVTREIERLVLAVVSDALRARARRRVTLRYVATAGTRVQLSVRRGRRTVARASATARPGRNRLAFRAPAAGRYTLVLSARDAAGALVSDRGRLTVRR